MIDDNISVFKGILPDSVSTATWQKALDNIKSDKYRKLIEQARTVKDVVKYRKIKTKLPSITFSGTFEKRRNCGNVSSTTGFILPDLDHLKNVELIFDLLTQDKNIWFVFRSPSGEGIKAGFRSQNIENDENHKIFYFSVERYFKEIYGITIDPACKDIARLTFVSHDPKLWINSDPQYFNVSAWGPISPPKQLAKPIDFSHSAGKQKYAMKVLESCCEEIKQSSPGNQHHTRLKAARLIGGYIQYLDESYVLSALERASITSGVKRIAPAMKTIKDGIEYGKSEPLEIEDIKKDDNRYDDQRKVSVTDNILDPIDPIDPERPRETPTDPAQTPNRPRTDPENSKTDPTDPTFKTAGTQNLTNDIFAFLSNTSGSFTLEFLDRELGLTTRDQKHRRAKIIRKILKKEYKNKAQILLKKDPKKANIYYLPNTEMEWIDLETEIEENFPIKLPFDLDRKISIPPKSIIIVAGSFNSGKTAIILNTLKLNLKSSFEKLFLVSEGAGEIRGRIRSFGDPLSLWKENMMIASQSSDFDTAIENYNIDGLTCVDYLEPPEGQYYLLTNQIRNIYDCLGTGVAMIALQKHSQATVGRGGEGTAEKARLYMTVDYLCTCKHGIACTLALTKVKQSCDENMQGKEIHFKIEMGSILTPLTDWMLSSRVNRVRCALEYENEDAKKSYKKVEDGDFVFRTENGDGDIKLVRITRKQAEKWAKDKPNIDVLKRLERMAKDSMEKLFLNKGYIWQISGILDREQALASQTTIGESG